MNERERQNIKEDKEFFNTIYIVLIAMAIIMGVTLWLAYGEQEKFNNQFETWNCTDLKEQLESDDHSQYREQMILKKLHIDDCYGK